MSEVTETGLDIIALTSISPNFGKTETFNCYKLKPNTSSSMIPFL